MAERARKSNGGSSREVAAAAKDEATTSGLPTISQLNENDVLLGRGTGYNEFEGNKRFRDIIEEHRKEYLSVKRREDKKKVAMVVMDKVTRAGGRFLMKPKSHARVTVAKNQTWIEVHREVALEKCKQGMRQQKDKPPIGDDDEEDDTAESKTDDSSGDRRRLYSRRERDWDEIARRRASDDRMNAITLMKAAPSLLGSSRHASSVGSLQGPAPSGVDPRLLLLENAAHSFQRHHLPLPQPPPRLQPPSATSVSAYVPNEIPGSRSSTSIVDLTSHRMLLEDLHARSLTDRMVQRSLGRQAQSHGVPLPPNLLVNEIGGLGNGNAARETAPSQHNEDAVFTLSALAVAGRPTFTEEQHALEQALLTDEERMAVLVDKFGGMRTMATDRRQSKRQRRDLDQASIDFLVEQMRVELDRMPSSEKVALLEAQENCADPEEFSDSRLTQFLRCEGFNVKLAARRFALYWSSRRDTFGDEKYLMRMTLAEALRDDLAAIEEGVMHILPEPDVSGRVLVFFEPHRRKGNGYTSESLLRAFWYMMEVVAERTTDVDSGSVVLGWDKKTTVFDFPREVYDPFIEFEKSCFPVRFVAVHTCCPTSIVMKVIRPVLLALTDKRARSRMVAHNVPEEDIAKVLENYGITKRMLPTEMGGTVELNQNAWMADRRAIELREIE